MLQLESQTKESYSGARFQPKLKIGQPGDKYEQEADAVADQVMRMSTTETMRMQPAEEEDEEMQPKLRMQPIKEEEEDVVQEIHINENERIFQKQKPIQSYENSIGTIKNTRLPSSVRNGLESLSGIDLSGVRVHYNSSKPSSINALAYTEGQDIHVGPGQEKYLPHEGWHAVQQLQGRVKPIKQIKSVSINDDKGLENEADVMGQKSLSVNRQFGEKQKLNERNTPLQKVAQKSTNYILTVTQHVPLRSAPGDTSATPGDFIEIDDGLLSVNRGTNMELLNSQQDWIEVRGEAVVSNNSSPSDLDVSAGIRSGWILRSESNLEASTNTMTENLRVAQDLDDLLDAEIIPAMLSWEIGVRTQGQAYSAAHQSFSDTLVAASQEAKARADFYAAVLTTVSVGALGWIGDAALNATSVTRILQSEALRGSIEDALQAGVGETIDIMQGGWFTQQVNRETHPLRYLNGALRALAGTKAELIAHVGSAKTAIGRSIEPVDRASILVQLYSWWNGARLRNTPSISESDQDGMAREFERNFWVKYILEDLTRIAPLPYYEGWTLHTYYHPESAVENRLDLLGISAEAGIDVWDSWYEPTNTSGPRDISDHIRAIGSTWTQRLYAWASNYTPNTFS